MSCKITQEQLQHLFEIFAKRAYEPGSCEPGTIEHDIVKTCEDLFKLDYTLITLDNQNGILSPNYPSRIFIPEYEIHLNGSLHHFAGVIFQQQQQQQHQHQYNYRNNIHEDLYDTGKLKDLITMAKYARCRQRFVIPVILYKGKYICRSATTSVMSEAYGRKVVDYAYDCINGITPSASTPSTTPSTTTSATTISSSQMTATITQSSVDDDNHDVIEDSLLPQTPESTPFSYYEIIKSDKQLLKTFNVTAIIDLMVEQRKMKYFMPVSSSEKADPENQYENFNLYSFPYPGCELFSKFRDNNYMAKNIYYNWKQSFNDAILNVPKISSSDYGNDGDAAINWDDYKNWDLVVITQNYLKTILRYIQQQQHQQDDDNQINNSNNSGILVHCISGWDRTPLFISLIRLSLWADGLIHQSLSPSQITYLTLAYDWYLFGHQLPDRLSRGEEILFFCFHVLKYITEDEFSVIDQRKRTKTSSSSGSSVVILKSDFCDDELNSSREECISVQNFDQDSNDSFSNCDMSSNENFCLTSRSPNPKRSKTSPISVPGVSACRQRNESTSSNGSWQVVTETGSIDSVMNNGSYMRVIQQDNNTNSNGANLSRENSSKPTSTLRKQRLNAVRAIFIQSYGKTVGLKFKEGSSINLVTFIGTIADQLF